MYASLRDARRDDIHGDADSIEMVHRITPHRTGAARMVEPPNDPESMGMMSVSYHLQAVST